VSCLLIVHRTQLRANLASEVSVCSQPPSSLSSTTFSLDVTQGGMTCGKVSSLNIVRCRLLLTLRWHREMFVATDSKIKSHSSWLPRPRLLYSLCPTVKDRVPARGTGETWRGEHDNWARDNLQRPRFCHRERRRGLRKTICCRRHRRHATAGQCLVSAEVHTKLQIGRTCPMSTSTRTTRRLLYPFQPSLSQWNSERASSLPPGGTTAAETAKAASKKSAQNTNALGTRDAMAEHHKTRPEVCALY